jgi:hypothetical protein
MGDDRFGSNRVNPLFERNRTMRKMYTLLTVLLALLVFTSGALAAQSKNFRAQLSGANEVPARDTRAHGLVFFQLKGESALKYRLKVANIENVFAAHIHCGAVGVNGPVGVTLFMGSPGSGPFDGVLASGTITAPDAGNNCGWATLADVVAAMQSGGTYVNVHTNDGVDPANTGPGDFPGGEIRGQISALGAP